MTNGDLEGFTRVGWYYEFSDCLIGWKPDLCIHERDIYLSGMNVRNIKRVYIQNPPEEGHVAQQSAKQKAPMHPHAEDALKAMAWMADGQTGVSSQAIAFKMCGIPLRDFNTAPRDAGDFSRCHKLLERYPEWRLRLNEMTALGRDWAALVPVWNKLEEMLLSGKTEQLFQIIQTLLHGQGNEQDMND